MDESHRAIVAAEEHFFNEYNTDHGESLHYGLQYIIIIV